MQDTENRLSVIKIDTLNHNGKEVNDRQQMDVESIKKAVAKFNEETIKKMVSSSTLIDCMQSPEYVQASVSVDKTTLEIELKMGVATINYWNLLDKFVLPCAKQEFVDIISSLLKKASDYATGDASSCFVGYR